MTNGLALLGCRSVRQNQNRVNSVQFIQLHRCVRALRAVVHEADSKNFVIYGVSFWCNACACKRADKRTNISTIALFNVNGPACYVGTAVDDFFSMLAFLLSISSTAICWS